MTMFNSIIAFCMFTRPGLTFSLRQKWPRIIGRDRGRRISHQPPLNGCHDLREAAAAECCALQRGSTKDTKVTSNRDLVKDIEDQWRSEKNWPIWPEIQPVVLVTRSHGHMFWPPLKQRCAAAKLPLDTGGSTRCAKLPMSLKSSCWSSWLTWWAWLQGVTQNVDGIPRNYMWLGTPPPLF